MQIKGMEPELIEIYNIRNLEMVDIWDMRLNATEGIVIVPDIMIMYDGGKTLSLCSKDKYFAVYAKKVMQVYNDEKDNILEDALTDPFRLTSTIRISERTKKILESGKLAELGEVYRFYYGKESYDSSLFFQSDEVKAILPIVRYHIERLFGFTDVGVKFGDEVTGYRDNYVLNGELDGIEKFFPCTFDKISDTEYEVYVGGLVSHSLPIRVRVTFKKDALNVLVDVNRYDLWQESSYRITNGEIKEIHDVVKRGLTISYTNENLEMVECPYGNVANVDERVRLGWFNLPWGAYYGMTAVVDDISECEKMIEIHNMYLDVRDECFFKQEYYSKTYKRNATVSVKSDEIVLADIVKRQLGVSSDKSKRIYVIETLFNDEALGMISSINKGRYFYHGCYTEKGLDGLEEERLVSLNKDNRVFNGSDLLNEYKLLKYVKGGK